MCFRVLIGIKIGSNNYLLIAICQQLYFELKVTTANFFQILEWIQVRVGFEALSVFWSAYRDQNWLYRLLSNGYLPTTIF